MTMKSRSRLGLMGVWLFLSTATTALAEDIEGVVKVAGAGINAQVMLAPPGADSGPKICANEIGKSVRRLGAMTVRVSGEWKLDKKGAKRCFEGRSLSVLKTSSGRDALVGTLSSQDGVYVVKDASGQTHTLGDVPGGLKKLDGQKVILDIKIMESTSNATTKGSVYKVVSYAAHP